MANIKHFSGFKSENSVIKCDHSFNYLVLYKNRKIYILDKDLRTKLFMQYSLTFYENLQMC